MNLFRTEEDLNKSYRIVVGKTLIDKSLLKKIKEI
jgi:hypothetical protein